MKIGESNQTRDKYLKAQKSRRQVSIKHTPFLEMLQEKDQPEPDFSYVLEDLDQLGQQLREKPNFENLHKYKEAVKGFLSQTITHAYNMEERRFIDHFGRRRVYLLVRQIDAKLEELTRLFFNRQGSTLNLAQKLDEIRGLLLDINS